METIARRQAQRAAATGEGEDADGMEALRRAAGGRGTFARIDEKGVRDDEENEGDDRLAGARIEADARDALERLCRYMALPAVAAGRVRELPDGNVAYRVKSPRSGAVTHRVMTPMEFKGRLAALVPPPRTPLVRYHGVLAPNSPWRVAVVPLPSAVVEVGDGVGASVPAMDGDGGRRVTTTKGRASTGRGCCGG